MYKNHLFLFQQVIVDEEQSIRGDLCQLDCSNLSKIIGNLRVVGTL
jgi:hypothetical protein